MRVALLTLCLCLLAPHAAHAGSGCGYVHRTPADGVPGVTPLAIGDSVMLGAAWKLSRRGFEVNTECGRNPAGGIEYLRGRRRQGTLPEIVVVALGSNIFMTSHDISRLLRVLGRQRTLMLVTQYRQWRSVSGGPMRRAARRRPGRVRLIDWSRRARGNPQWFWGDGTHLRDGGERAYARLLQAAAWSKQRGRFGRPLGAATASCGHARLRPRNAPAGVAPLAIGDSVMIDAARRLSKLGLEVDAKCGRSPSGGLYVLRNRRARRTLPESVVFALGTNWWIAHSHLRRAVRLLGPRRTLFLVTPYRSWQPVSNAPIRWAAARWPRRVKVIEWSAQAARHPYWLEGDGAHLRSAGIGPYGRMVKRAVWQRQRGAFGAMQR